MYSGSVAATGTQSCGAAAASASARSWSRPGVSVAGACVALQDQAGIRLVRRQRDRGVEQGLVFHHAARLQAAGRRDDHLRLGVGDAGGQFGRGEAAEHDGMDRAQPGAGEHGDRRLRHHRHVDHHAVALGHAERGQRAGELRRAAQQLGVGEGLARAGHRAVPDQRGLVAAAGLRRGGRGSCSRCSASAPANHWPNGAEAGSKTLSQGLFQVMPCGFAAQHVAGSRIQAPIGVGIGCGGGHARCSLGLLRRFSGGTGRRSRRTGQRTCARSPIGWFLRGCRGGAK